MDIYPMLRVIVKAQAVNSNHLIDWNSHSLNNGLFDAASRYDAIAKRVHAQRLFDEHVQIRKLVNAFVVRNFLK